ncbi:PEF-CTERM sorting domain-containing protein [Methanosarcina sp. MTP4]|uniref:PEF-CTERM sorting domain-containing protein n=1 Tax=Methanosarcina sp. MTP4 TaxID=1434100 RepID=UPI00064FE214|nr:PEF-CTERM sorting domain-containing protein [Methanosarcina sp. MTP4]
MVKIKNLFFGILILFLMVNTCSAGFSLLVSPVDNIYVVSPGESISYNVIVNDSGLIVGIPDLSSEDVFFSINRTSECPANIDENYWSPDWVYTFNPSTVTLDDPTESEISILTLTVPADAAPGYYYHPVEAKVWNAINYFCGEPGIAQVYVTGTDVNNIPEFPTIVVPVIAILGLVTMFGRRNNKT